jgi:lipoprotein-anchoring transpeptidase ErfK/SrfK
MSSRTGLRSLIRYRFVSASLLACAVLGVATAYAAPGIPPWSDPNDIPIQAWAKSVAPHDEEIPVFNQPTRVTPRRGALFKSARPPLYGALRGPGCNGRWLQIGPAAWICSDEVELAADDPAPFVSSPALPARFADDGLAFHYAFVGPDGASAFRSLERAEEETPEVDLDPGFAVAIVEEADAHGQRWGKTRHGVWIALRQLNVVRPLTLHGEVLQEGQGANVGWVLPDHAVTYADPKSAKSLGVRMRFELVHRHEEEKGAQGAMVRVSDDGAPSEWMRAKDLAHPTIAAPPDEVVSRGPSERWVDVELATETLVAYVGTRPVYAALVSTGRGAQGSETATPRGVHHIWVKLTTSTMGNLGDEDAESHYSIEDVPYVQFFAKGVALHGAFWHHSFGAAHSHGCVNLAPVDARWLFEFTGPHLPAGWSAVLPAGTTDPGTIVRVR